MHKFLDLHLAEGFSLWVYYPYLNLVLVFHGVRASIILEIRVLFSVEFSVIFSTVIVLFFPGMLMLKKLCLSGL